MKKRYMFHPQEFAIGETEKFYSEMAARGWELENRGAWLSRFRRAEEDAVRYRIEVASPKLLEDGQLPEEQVAVYEDCGWEYVTGHGLIHVFRAPEGSSAPEFYLEPEQHAATLKGLRKRYVSSMLWGAVYPLFMLLLTLLMFGADDVVRKFTNLYIACIRGTELILGVLMVLLLCTIHDVQAVIHLSRLCSRMKRGIPLDHAPKRKNRLMILIRYAAAAAALVFFAIGLTSHNSGALPETADGPYLLLSDAGYAGQRTESWVNGRESTLEHSRSLLSEVWDCYEIVLVDGEDLWMYQDVYELKSAGMTDRMVEILMYNSTFAGSPEVFEAVEVEGLDQAWVTGRLECIAVKGNRVCMLTASVPYEREALVGLLQAVAAHWKET